MALGGLSEPLIKDTAEVPNKSANETSDVDLVRDKCQGIANSPAVTRFSTAVAFIVAVAACKMAYSVLNSELLHHISSTPLRLSFQLPLLQLQWSLCRLQLYFWLVAYVA